MRKGKLILIASTAVLSMVALSSAIGVSMALVMSADDVPQLATQKRCIYVNVADSPAWQNYSGQKIAAYVWKYGDENVQAGFIGGTFMERLGTSSTYYRVVMPSDDIGYNRIIFARCCSILDTPTFTEGEGIGPYCWDQTEDLVIPDAEDGNDCFTLKSSSTNKRQWSGTWGDYNAYTYSYSAS